MTVGELIKELEAATSDMDVEIGSWSGDFGVSMESELLSVELRFSENCVVLNNHMEPKDHITI